MLDVVSKMKQFPLIIIHQKNIIGQIEGKILSNSKWYKDILLLSFLEKNNVKNIAEINSIYDSIEKFNKQDICIRLDTYTIYGLGSTYMNKDYVKDFINIINNNEWKERDIKNQIIMKQDKYRFVSICCSYYFSKMMFGSDNEITKAIFKECNRRYSRYFNMTKNNISVHIKVMFNPMKNAKLLNTYNNMNMDNIDYIEDTMYENIVTGDDKYEYYYD